MARNSTFKNILSSTFPQMNNGAECIWIFKYGKIKYRVGVRGIDIHSLGLWPKFKGNQRPGAYKLNPLKM